VLRVGLTGGIGSGKSTVARRLVARGAVLVDSDVLAREAVAPGTDGLAEVAATFGDGVLDGSGALDRPALAAVVFGDPEARERLNAIVHPRVRERSAELIAAAPADAVVVQDIPLLVENGMAPLFPLVVVVHADAEERVRRLVRRGMPEADARARIAAQASDEGRRAAADVWLDNSGDERDLEAAVDALWERRLVPFESNLRERQPVAAGAPRLVDHDNAKPPGSPVWPERIHGSADPGRPVNLHIREVGSPGWRYALLLRDWLRTDAAARAEYLAVKRTAAERGAGDPDADRYVELKEPWFDAAAERAGAWAATSAWVPSLD
jgi:dephospho-CoA kinase